MFGLNVYKLVVYVQDLCYVSYTPL